MKAIAIIIGVIGILAIAAAIIFLRAWLFMLAWNFVTPVFSGPVLTFWQSFAIAFILSMIGGWFKSTTKKD